MADGCLENASLERRRCVARSGRASRRPRPLAALRRDRRRASNASIAAYRARRRGRSIPYADRSRLGVVILVPIGPRGRVGANRRRGKAPVRSLRKVGRGRASVPTATGFQGLVESYGGGLGAGVPPSFGSVLRARAAGLRRQTSREPKGASNDRGRTALPPGDRECRELRGFDGVAMRILLIADWPRLEGGTERYVEWVRGGLEASGHEVRLLTGSTGTAGGGTADYVAPSSDRLLAQAFLQVANPRAAARVRSAVRDFSPDAVFVTTFLTHLSPAILAPLRRVPTVVLVMDYRPVCPIATKLLPDDSICAEVAGLVCWRNGCVSLPHWLRDRPRYALLRGGLASVDRVLACSDWVRERLREGGIASESIVLPVPPPGAAFRALARGAAPICLYRASAARKGRRSSPSRLRSDRRRVARCGASRPR